MANPTGRTELSPPSVTPIKSSLLDQRHEAPSFKDDSEFLSHEVAMIAKLTTQERQAALASLSGWQEVAGRDAIQRKVKFADFRHTTRECVSAHPTREIYQELLGKILAWPPDCLTKP